MKINEINRKKHYDDQIHNSTHYYGSNANSQILHQSDYEDIKSRQGGRNASFDEEDRLIAQLEQLDKKI